MKKLTVLLVIFGVSSLWAQSPYRGVYLGAGAGSADLGSFDSAAFVEVHIGFRYGRYFALEAGYLQFGDFEFDDPSKSVTKEANGLKILALGHLPLSERFGLYAGAGLFNGDTDEDVTIDGVTHTEGDSDTGLALEGGIQFRLGERLTLDLEYARYVLDMYDFDLNLNGDEFDVNMGDDEVTAVKLSLSYRF